MSTAQGSGGVVVIDDPHDVEEELVQELPEDQLTPEQEERVREIVAMNLMVEQVICDAEMAALGASPGSAAEPDAAGASSASGAEPPEALPASMDDAVQVIVMQIQPIVYPHRFACCVGRGIDHGRPL